MDILVLLGRILLGSIAVGSGLGGHFGATEATAAYAESRGVGNARLLTQLTGVMLVLAGLSLILGIYPDAGALLFVAFLVPTNFMVHHFWTDTDPMAKQMEMTQFMKNLSITGGALLAYVLFQMLGADAPFQITGPLF